MEHEEEFEKSDLEYLRIALNGWDTLSEAIGNGDGHIIFAIVWLCCAVVTIFSPLQIQDWMQPVFFAILAVAFRFKGKFRQRERRKIIRMIHFEVNPWLKEKHGLAYRPSGHFEDVR